MGRPHSIRGHPVIKVTLSLLVAIILCSTTTLAVSEEKAPTDEAKEEANEYFDHRQAYALVGDFERGKQLASQSKRFPRSCRFCHGADGIAPGDHHPNLAGQKEKYLRQQLISFIFLQRRSHIMNQTLVDFDKEQPLYSEQEIADLSSYFSRLSPLGDGAGETPARE